LAWTDDNAVVAPPRRRAAERALFVANPDTPVSLADLLAAPLPPVTATLVERTVESEPSAEAVAFENTDVAPFPALPSATLTTAAAVAVLLATLERHGVPPEQWSNAVSRWFRPPVKPAPSNASPINSIRAFREAHRWGLWETKVLMERADVNFNVAVAEALVAAGLTEEQVRAEGRAAQAARR
jgi:hypothetical protein